MSWIADPTTAPSHLSLGLMSRGVPLEDRGGHASGVWTRGAYSSSERRRCPPCPRDRRCTCTPVEDEASFVIEGVLTVVLGTEQFDVPAGGVAWLPRGVPHTFANLTREPVRVLGMIVPGDLEAMFVEQSAYFRSLQGPPDPGVVDEIGQRYGVTVVGPPVAMPTG